MYSILIKSATCTTNSTQYICIIYINIVSCNPVNSSVNHPCHVNEACPSGLSGDIIFVDSTPQALAYFLRLTPSKF